MLSKIICSLNYQKQKNKPNHINNLILNQMAWLG